MSTRTTFTLEQKAEVYALYQLGYTSRFIASKTGIKFESVRTIIKNVRNKKLSKSELTAIDTAKQSIRTQVENELSDVVGSALQETLFTQQRIREQCNALLDAIEETPPQDAYEASAHARSIAAISTSIKSGADFSRVLRKEIHTSDGFIETFVVQTMGDEEIEQIQRNLEEQMQQHRNS